MNRARAAMEALGCSEGIVLSPVAGGRDTAIWRVQWNGEDYALRVLRPEQRGAAQREVAAMRTARESGLPVPEVVRFGTWEGRPAQLIAWVPGETMFSILQHQPERVEELGDLLGRTLAAIHVVSAPPEFDVLPDAPGATLLHRDFHPLNVLIDGDRVTGIIDWTDTCAGNPLADIAQSITLIAVAPLPPDIPSGPIEAARAALLEALVAGYTSLRGPLPPASEMARFYARAGQRMYATMETRSRQPDSGITPECLEIIRDWITRYSAN